jgi:hypothetical protein
VFVLRANRLSPEIMVNASTPKYHAHVVLPPVTELAAYFRTKCAPLPGAKH